ncbi:phosphatidate cytidylyltransferase [soil metagenome]
MAIKVGEIGLRAASASVLVAAAVAATWVGREAFLALVLIACGLLAVEWGRMSAPGAWRASAIAVGIVLAVCVVLTYVGQLSLALVLLVFGAAAAGLYNRTRGHLALNAAYGVLYLGWPVVLLIWLRDGHDKVGLHWTALVFAVTWSADIVAYLVGSAIGGPKLWPRFSPNKTWSGFIGGLTAGMLAGAGMAAWLEMGRLTIFWGAVLGLAAALATMAGDLWESALKRRFGVKDAGTLIPGHGGLLDRVDGLMFAVVIVAAGRFIMSLVERGF